MKISFRKRPHICNRHLQVCSILGGWNELPGINGTCEFCLICGRVRNHDEYGSIITLNWVPKRYRPEYYKNKEKTI